MLQQAQQIGYDILKTTAATMAVDMTVKQPIKNALPSNVAGASYVADGVIYALVSDIVDLASEGRSLLSTGQYFYFADNALYFGLISAGADKTGLALKTYEQIAKVSPMPKDTNVALTNGALVSGGRVAIQLIENNPQTPDILKMVRRPLTTISNRVM